MITTMSAHLQLIKHIYKTLLQQIIAQDAIIPQMVDQISSEMELHHVDVSWIQLYEANEDDRKMITVVNILGWKCSLSHYMQG